MTEQIRTAGTVPFKEATPGDRSVVWCCPPGDDYGWVSDPEHFEDRCDKITVKRQVWHLVDEADTTWRPPTEMCDDCGGEGVVDNPNPSTNGEDGPHVRCGTCLGDGGHPDAGRWVPA
jgi:hypothetical protein